jgi:hypothetical protein
MKRLTLLLVFVVLLCCGCTDMSEANRVLSAQGYTKIQSTGYAFWSCGQDDFYHTGFIATSPNGTRVEGTVCSGIFFKGATVRFD